MKKQVLFVILDHYADWECSFLAAALLGGIGNKTSHFEVKTLSLSRNPVKSIGGFTTLPDYGIDDFPADFAGLVLVGGLSWRTEEAKQLVPLVKRALLDRKTVGAICDATVFLGVNGLLNDKCHTSNTLEDLKYAAKENYTNSENFLHAQAARDGNLVTANGTAYLEFAKELMLALNAYPNAYVESNYQFFKQGYIEIMKTMH